MHRDLDNFTLRSGGGVKGICLCFNIFMPMPSYLITDRIEFFQFAPPIASSGSQKKFSQVSNVLVLSKVFATDVQRGPMYG